MVLKLPLYIINVISFSSKLQARYPDIYNFFSQIVNLSDLDYNVTVTSYLGDVGNYFGVYIERRYLTILWYQLDVSKEVSFVSSHG